jgi:hypothetical protein
MARREGRSNSLCDGGVLTNARRAIRLDRQKLCRIGKALDFGCRRAHGPATENAHKSVIGNLSDIYRLEANFGTIKIYSSRGRSNPRGLNMVREKSAQRALGSSALLRSLYEPVRLHYRRRRRLFRPSQALQPSLSGGRGLGRRDRRFLANGLYAAECLCCQVFNRTGAHRTRVANARSESRHAALIGQLRWRRDACQKSRDDFAPQWACRARRWRGPYM